MNETTTKKWKIEKTKKSTRPGKGSSSTQSDWYFDTFAEAQVVAAVLRQSYPTSRYTVVEVGA